MTDDTGSTLVLVHRVQPRSTTGRSTSRTGSEPGVGAGAAPGKKISFTSGVGSDDGIGLGRPADFDGDGTSRVPVADGSNRLVLVDSGGNVDVLVGSGVAKSPVASVDWDDDGELEVVYLTDDGDLILPAVTIWSRGARIRVL